jgi:hypothetical protein
VSEVEFQKELIGFVCDGDKLEGRVRARFSRLDEADPMAIVVIFLELI